MTRSATHWHHTVDRYGRKILFITSDEIGVLSEAICAVFDGMSEEVSYRLVDGKRVALDPESDAPYPERGLIVFGRSKHNRLSLMEARGLDGLHMAAVADAVEAAISVTA